MKYQLKAYNIHELGQRQNQEDSLFPAYGKATQEDRLFILCDGMGGHEKGEVASATVCETISQAILTHWNIDEPLSDDLLRQAIDGAYDALDAKDDNAERKMGTTLTLLCLHANGATIAHIGDSRVYQFRPDKGIVFRTQDHSLVNDLIKIGEITEEEAKTHPQKNVITRAMQPHQPSRAKADIANLTDIKAGDYFFLCSDGMLEQSTDENLANVITKKVPDEQKVEMLRSMTEENKDNHTAHLIHIEKVNGAIVESTPLPKDKEPVGTWVDVDMPKPKPLLKKKLSIYIIGALAIALLVFAGVLTYKMIYDKPTTKNEIKQAHVTTTRRATPKLAKDSLKKDSVSNKTKNNDTIRKSKDDKVEKLNFGKTEHNIIEKAKEKISKDKSKDRPTVTKTSKEVRFIKQATETAKNK